MPTIASIILAAGPSRRLGEAKQFLRYEGETLLYRSVRAAVEASLDPIVIIAGHHHEEIAKELKALRVAVFYNPEWECGIGSSIRAGVRGVLEIAPQIEAVMVQVCDQPFISAQILQSLAMRHLETPSRIAATTYGDTVGVPALFPRPFFARLQSLANESGAKSLILEVREDVIEVPFPMGRVDIDTPEDREAFIQSTQGEALQPESCGE